MSRSSDDNRRRHDLIFAELARHHGSASEHEDVLQEAMTELARRAEQLAELVPAARFAYARRVAVRKALDARRGSSRRRLLETQWVRERDSRVPTPEDVYLRSESINRKLALLARLTPRLREIVELEAQGLSASQMAAVLGKPLGTVLSQMRRVRITLRRWCQRDE